MQYTTSAIRPDEIPAARLPLLSHMVETYASETNKVHAAWRSFSDANLDFRPHARSMSVAEVMKHQIQSERNFFARFLDSPEPPLETILPAETTVDALAMRQAELARPRVGYIASRDAEFWLSTTQFFDVERQRIWIFWRRVMHTAHHRTQLTVYLRLLDKPVLGIYGPTADTPR